MKSKKFTSNSKLKKITIIGLPILIISFWGLWTFFNKDANSLSALFSGLAFAGLGIGLYLQREEIQLQRADLSLQRKELELTREVLEGQEKQLAEQTKLIEQQFLNQRISRIEENIQRLLQGYIQVIHGLEKVLGNSPIQHEGRNLCIIILDSFEKFKNNNNSDESFFQNMDNGLKKRYNYISAELSLSIENILLYYDSIVIEQSLPQETINNFLILIKSHLPFYLRCYIFYFAKFHNTGDINIELRKLITKYLLDDFDELTVRFLICQDIDHRLAKFILEKENYTVLQRLLREIIDSKQ